MYSTGQEKSAIDAQRPSAVQAYVLWAQREILKRAQRQRDEG
jgi:hypothetical protein